MDQAVFATTLDGALRSDRICSRRYDEYKRKQRQVPPMLPPSPTTFALAGRAAAAAPLARAVAAPAAPSRQVPSAAEVQLLALQHCPMGSVSLEQVKASLCGLRNPSPFEKLLPRAGWSIESDWPGLSAPSREDSRAF